MWTFVLSLLIISQSITSTVATYDLIDASPRCYSDGYCLNYGSPGTYTAAHPNSEEKAQMVLINLARMYPTYYIGSVYGLKKYGRSGPSWSYYTADDSAYCGIAATTPYWWMSNFNQATRFAEYDCANCASSCGHNTCSTSCYLFGGECDFGTRCDAFTVEDKTQYGIYCSGEGLCGGNLCYADGHCPAIFDRGSRVFAVGFEPGTNGIAITYTKYPDDKIDTITSLTEYPIVNVCHFDQRVKVNYQWLNSDDKYLTFMLQWFSTDKDVDKAWVAYNGVLTEMTLVDSTMTTKNGFYTSTDTVK